ncbi:MAG TPA: HAMP domain-containing histidine kinase [Candidatus Eubacterium faecale]|uniref:histidine kinase n=1 Tax=Candidatus Eubacterium faecale TaxID=2838568 RepID=A0A9D2MJ17_9FIRM|nr:HAMP domain-containing histidine kinase [Candidatus Eubacterium faecale]
MDTKWIKFKYGSFNKCLCALLAAVLAGVFAVNAVTVLRHAAYFGSDGIVNRKSVGYIDTYEFKGSLEQNIATIIDDVSHNTNQAAYDSAKAATVTRAAQFFEAALPVLQDYEDQLAEYRLWENGYTNYDSLEYPSLNISAQEYEDVTTVDYDDYSHTFNFALPVQDDALSDTLSISFTVDNILDLPDGGVTDTFNTQFGNQAYYSYCHDTAEAGESAQLGLKNVRYYAEFSDGSIAANVQNAEEIDSLVQNENYEYFTYENGDTSASDRLSGVNVYNGDYYGNTADNVRLYLAVNPAFSENDVYGTVSENLAGIESIDANAALYTALFSLLGFAAFAVISVRLAGNKSNGTVAAAAVDKLPLDIGFILMAAFVAFLAALVLQFTERESSAIFGYDAGPFYYISLDFYESQWYRNILFAIGAAAYLSILGFSVSLARNAKTGVNILKHTLFYKILMLIGRFFRWILKGFKKIKNFFATLGFLPKQLDKRAVWAVALFSLFNILGMSFVALFFAAFGLDFTAFMCGFVCFVLVIAVDAVCVYKAFQFMRALDRMIDCSAKNEPVDIDTAKLPQCLKTLADSLDEKNAALQEAVIKAVKDERTKTELITNVSHDLKTPLTSVINYIDLLKKCEIRDETAVKYMGVIDEKANRLKRLIEDLIEASKVSTGNVVLHKTKINLNELATQAIVEYADDFEKNGLDLIFDETAQKHIVFADGTKIFRVFENLLSNAKKYSAPGSRVYARLYSDNENGYFEIKNISKDPLNISAEELMERFVRGDKSRSEEGNGLGLSIAKELCSLNGGWLTISIDGDLFKATVRLPKNGAEETDEKQI